MNSWTPERLRAMFRAYADIDFPGAGAHLYARIADGIADDDQLLALAADVRDGQPPVNLLFAAVHRLLLTDAAHPLAAYYPDLTEKPRPADEGAAPLFRQFCFELRDPVVELIQTRLVQTNVLERCGALFLAFAFAEQILRDRVPAANSADRPLAMIEIGASAGLNLLWDKYGYRYGSATWGDAASPVQLNVEVRGDVPLPPLAPDLRAASSAGIDIDPVDLRDEESLLWQRALMWPERLDRQRNLQAARTIMRRSPPEVVAGDAAQVLSDVLERAPSALPLCVFASYTLYQFPPEGHARVIEILREHSRKRPIAFVVNEIKRIGDPHGVVELTLFDGNASPTLQLARAHPHGYWLEWTHRDGS